MSRLSITLIPISSDCPIEHKLADTMIFQGTSEVGSFPRVTLTLIKNGGKSIFQLEQYQRVEIVTIEQTSI